MMNVAVPLVGSPGREYSNPWRLGGLAALIALLAVIGPAHAASAPKSVSDDIRREPVEWSDVWVAGGDRSDLPRVLLVGDSIVKGYYSVVEQELKGRALVARFATSKSICDPSFMSELNAVLGQYRFDVIHFNNGLHGWGYSEAQYAGACRNVLARLRDSGSAVIVGLSTPVRMASDLAKVDPVTERVNGRNLLLLHEAQQGAMPVDDLFALVISNKAVYSADGVHFNTQGQELLGRQVAAAADAMLSPACTKRVTCFRVVSPDGKIVVQIATNTVGRLLWTTGIDGTNVVGPSALDMEVDGVALGQVRSVGAVRTHSLSGSYPLFGNHAVANYSAHEAVAEMHSGSVAWRLHVRAYNEGVAIRYEIPSAGPHTVTADRTAWSMPGESLIWWSAYGYENLWKSSVLSEIAEDLPLSPPATVQLAESEVCLSFTEADNAAFPDMGLKRVGRNLVATWPAVEKDWKIDGPVLSPWRVAMVSRNLDALVNNDLLTHLCPPARPDLAKADWIKPGRALWHWWAVGDPVYAEQRDWIDAARKLNCRYYLVDDGWKKWKDGSKDAWDCLRTVVDYGRSNGVSVLVWVACKDLWEPSARRAYLSRIAAIGAAGIKIDFFPEGHAGTIKWMEGALADTADLKLLCDFHGCVKPTGRRRTWPQELTREAVRGHEYHITRYNRTMPRDQYTILPFTRLLLGPADFTPVVFDPSELRGYTWANELAQAVIMTSPLQHFADHYRNLVSNPASEVLREIPVTWDRTMVLPGSAIGARVAFARRSGDTWYVGVINGATASSMSIALDFLGRGDYELKSWGDLQGRADGWQCEQRTVDADGTIRLELQPGGGYVGILKHGGK